MEKVSSSYQPSVYMQLYKYGASLSKRWFGDCIANTGKSKVILTAQTIFPFLSLFVYCTELSRFRVLNLQFKPYDEDCRNLFLKDVQVNYCA